MNSRFAVTAGEKKKRNFAAAQRGVTLAGGWVAERVEGVHVCVCGACARSRRRGRVAAVSDLTTVPPVPFALRCCSLLSPTPTAEAAQPSATSFDWPYLHRSSIHSRTRLPPSQSTEQHTAARLGTAAAADPTEPKRITAGGSHRQQPVQHSSAMSDGDVSERDQEREQQEFEDALDEQQRMQDEQQQQHHYDDQQQYDDGQYGGGGGGGDGGDGGSGNGGGGSGGQYDEDEDEEPVPAFLPADHRLMAPVQAALRKELSARDARVSLALREKETQLLAVKKRREELGVELYSTQQGLAKLQLELERRHDKYETAARQRSVQEGKLKQALEAYQRTCAQRDELEKKRSTHAHTLHMGACGAWHRADKRGKLSASRAWLQD